MIPIIRTEEIRRKMDGIGRALTYPDEQTILSTRRHTAGTNARRVTVHRTPPAGPPRASTLLRRALALTAVAGILGLGAPLAAQAAPEAPLVATFAITSPVNGAFSGVNSVTVSGTGTEEGATVTVTVGGGAGCTATVTENADGELRWQCTVPRIANGADRTLTATESGSDPAPAPVSVTIDVLGPPTIDPIPVTTGIVTGTAHPGAVVTVTLDDNAGTCVAGEAPSTGYWSCTLASAGGRVPSETYTASARQSHPAIGGGQPSATTTRPVTVDSTPPAPPVIVEPVGDYRVLTLPARFAGTGEPGGSVDVYMDGIPVCSARIAPEGTWSCFGGSTLSSAAHSVSAIQIDAAGNYGSPSEAIRVFFGPERRPSEPQPRPTENPAASPNAEPSAEPSPSATRTPTASIPRPTRTPALAGDAAPDALTNWGTPTTLGDGLPLLHESVERGNWGRAPLLALAAIGLIALPLRLLASELRGRGRPRPTPVRGRNREPVPLTEQHTTGANPWLAIVVPFMITVAFMVISDGVKGEVRYLRLTAAVAIALAVLNLVGVAIAARFAHLWKGIDARVRLRPMLLAAAIITGLFSRLVGLTPPLLSGTLIGVRMPHDTPVRPRAVANLLQVGAVLMLGLLGWVGHAIVGDVVGFWPSLTSETLAALCLVGIGSSLVLMLPIGALPGRVLWEWHRPVWFVIAFVVATIAGAILLGGASADFPLAVALIVAGILAVTCLSAWAVLRFVAPRNA